MRDHVPITIKRMRGKQTVSVVRGTSILKDKEESGVCSHIDKTEDKEIK
jgi:hypothetical protein